ncbi:MAG: hypothetical protein KF865_12625 [Bdellovibrionaceae bacterium]|nr:hypothetical protein [Pseudobdellovibrionaceae bacterium]
MIAFSSGLSLARAEFDDFRSLLKSRTGIHLSDAKVGLMQSRLRPRLNQLRLQAWSEYRAYLKSLPPALL